MIKYNSLKKVALALVLILLSYIPSEHLLIAFYASYGPERDSYVDYGFLHTTTTIFAMAVMLFLLFLLFFQEQTIRVMESVEKRIGFGFLIVFFNIIIMAFSLPVRAVFLKRIDGFVECKELRFSGRRMSSRTYAINNSECMRLIKAKRGL